MKKYVIINGKKLYIANLEADFQKLVICMML